MRVELMMNVTRLAVLATVMVLLAAGACSREQAGETRKVATGPPVDLATAGAIGGEVRFEGTPPPQSTVDVSSAGECAKGSKTVPAGDILVKDGKVQNAVVYVKEGLGERGFAPPATEVVIDQKGCLFDPRIAVVQTGQPVRFLNSDPLPHNVHGLPDKSSPWNFSLGVKGAARTVTVDEPEHFITIKCDIHPWMRGYLGVFDHPYFAITGVDGRFTLPNLPPGSYVVEAWHERFGTKTANVTVGAKETKSVDFSFGPAPTG